MENPNGTIVPAPLSFRPDVIVETTNACNRSCRGCYAPNILMRKNATEGNDGILFLSTDDLARTWPSSSVRTVSIRGGEPTLNPHIGELLQWIAARAEAIYLETNGEWIVEDAPLLDIVASTGCVLKLSFDRMHGTTSLKAQAILSILEKRDIGVAVAITEPTQTAFEQTKTKVVGHFAGPIFWQKTATTQEELVVPSLGVIGANGRWKTAVTSLFGKYTAALVVFLSFLFGADACALTQVEIGIAANFSAMSDSTSNPYSNYLRNAVDMAFAEARGPLRAKGIEVKVREFDCGDDKLLAVKTAHLAAQSPVLAVMGYVYSSAALLAGPIFQENNLLLLSPSATSDRLDQIGRYVRRSCFNDSRQGTILAEHALEREKAKTAAIVAVADCAYCQSLRASFKERFEAGGGKVVFDEGLLSGATDVSALVSKLKKKQFDTILIPNYEKISAILISQLYDAGIRPKFWLGGDGWGNSVDLFFRIIGKRNFTAYTVSHWHISSTSKASRAFSDAFLKKYRKAPVDTAVLAYDATRLLIEGLLRSKALTREGLIQAVESVRSYDGVTGHFAYAANARTPVKSAVLLRFQDGESRLERLIP